MTGFPRVDLLFFPEKSYLIRILIESSVIMNAWLKWWSIILLFVLSSSQDYDFTTYDNHCIPANSYRFDNGAGSVESYFDDDDGDCKSDRWVNIFTYGDGTIEYYDQNRWFHTEGTKWFDFSKPFFNCCSQTSSSGGLPSSGSGSGGWDGSGSGFSTPPDQESCDCDIEISGNTITVFCPCIFSRTVHN